MNWEDRHSVTTIKEAILALADGIKKEADYGDLSIFAMSQGIPYIVKQDNPVPVDEDPYEESLPYNDSNVAFQDDYKESNAETPPVESPKVEVEVEEEYYESSWVDSDY